MRILAPIALSTLFALCGPLLAAELRGPELEVQTGHQDQVYKVAISPDGSKAASASADGSVKIWDVASGLQLYTWQLSSFSSRWKGGGTPGLVFSQNGKRLAVASGKVAVFDLDRQAEILTLRPEFPANRAQLSPDGKRLYFASHGKKDSMYGASADHPSSVTVLDVDSGRQIEKWPTHDWMTTAMQISPDGRTLVTASGNKEMSFWNAESGSQIRKAAMADVVQDLAFFADGKRVAAAVGDKYGSKRYEVQFFDAAGNGPESFQSFKSEIRGLAFSADSKTLALVTREEGLLSFDTASRKQLMAVPKSKGVMHGVAITPDAAYVYVTTGSGDITESGDNAVLIFQANNGKLLRKMRNLTKEALDIAVSRNNRMIVANGPDGARLWDLPTGRVLQSFDALYKDINAADISADGRVVAYAWYKELGVEVVEPGGNFRNRVAKGANLVKQVRLSPRGDSVLVLSSSELARWSVRSGARERAYAIRDGDCREVWTDRFAMNGEGNRLAFLYRCRTGENWSSSKRAVAIFDVESGSALSRIDTRTDDIDNVSMSGDGRLVFVGYSGSKQDGRLYDAQDGKMLRAIEGGRRVSVSVFAPDGGTLYTGDTEGMISVWDVATGKRRASVKAHGAEVTSLVQQQGRFLLSASADGRTTMWDVSPLRARASFVSFADREYAAITPDNYYQLSKKGVDGIAFRHNMRAYRYDQFDLRYNRPDRVIAAIGLAPASLQTLYASAYRKRLKRHGLTEQDLNRDVTELPQLTIAVTIPPSVSTPTLALPLKASGGGNRLTRLHVAVNGVPVAGTAGETIDVPAGGNFDKAINVALSPGKNVVTVAVQNAAGLRSLEQAVTVNADLPKRKPDVYVLGIGVSAFSQKDYNLTYAAKDALDLTSLFQSNPGGRFGSVKVMTLADQKATREGILQAKDFLRQSKIDDIVIVHVASHGVLDDKLDYFLATTDMDFNNPALRGLRYEELEGLLDGIPSRQKLMLVDACHSGEVDKDDSQLVASAGQAGLASGVSSRGLKAVQSKSGAGLANSFDMMKELFSELQRGSGTFVISSASGKEFAFESAEWKNGVFTYSMLEGLRSGKADLDRNGEVTVSELRDYSAREVLRLTNGQQTPSSRVENLESSFRVW